MTQQAHQIQTHLRSIGEYGTSTGWRPWVVADVTRYYESKPAEVCEAFLLWIKQEVHSWYTVAMALNLDLPTLLIVSKDVEAMASLLDSAVVA